MAHVAMEKVKVLAMLILTKANIIENLFHKLCLNIDGVIYNFIKYLYSIFYDISTTNFFSRDSYAGIANRLYIVIGIVMLFVLSYSLLKAIVNPDDFAKGEQSFPNLIKNLVITFVIIALLPTVFSVAMSVQTSIVQSNVIGKIVMESDGEDYSSTSTGVAIAWPIFEAFFHLKDGVAQGQSDGVDKYISISDDLRNNQNDDFTEFAKKSLDIATAIEADEIEYNFPFSTIAGGFAVWVLLLFCIDLGIRVIKLAFYQIISPIPAICRILPGANNKKIWDNWVKVTLATYFEIFIRIAVLYLGVYFIILISDSNNIPSSFSNNALLVKALIIMGVIAFMRQAPKLISDIFGFDSSNMNLGLKGLRQRLSDGGAYAVGGAALGSAAMLRNGVSSFAKKENWKNQAGKVTAGSILKNTVRGLGSGAAGFVGGAARGLVAGSKAKNIKEAYSDGVSAITKATEAKDKRWRYSAAHGGFVGATKARIADVGKGIARFAGFNNPEDVKREMDAINETQSAGKDLTETIKAQLVDDARKGKTFNYGTSRSTTQLRQLEEAMNVAIQHGSAEERIKATDDYNKYLKDFVNEIAEKSMEGEGTFNKTLNSLTTQDERVALKAMRVKADTYRATLARNLDSEFVKMANKRAREIFILKQGDITSGFEDYFSKLEDEIKERYKDKDGRTIDVSKRDAEISALRSNKEKLKTDWIDNLTDEARKKLLESHEETVKSVMKSDGYKELEKDKLITYETLQSGLKMGDGTGSKNLGPVMDNLLSEDQIIYNSMKQEEKTKDDKK